MTATRILTLSAVSAGAILALSAIGATDVAAQGVWTTLQSKTSEGFTNTRNLVFLLGGFGIIGLAVMAFFGRFQWKWFAALIGGMVLLAVTGSVIEYVTTSNSSGTITNDTSKYNDTLRSQ